MTSLTIPELIGIKRDGGSFTEAQIHHLIEGFTASRVTDYQMTALAMAIYLNGMSPKETAALTLAMRDSGRVVSLGGPERIYVDKHSTGGVGDKVSICLAPIVAACGVRVPMVSGRGLGHTGGTLDKLEAIPGFSVDMTVEAFIEQTNRIGCALIGQTADIAPADKRLYALRDVTGTVASIPLITASILSKKLAEGIGGLVLDVKVGRGAFMQTLEDARELAGSLVRVGHLAKKKVTAVLTTMDSPLGRTIGNALETREAIELLHDQAPADLKEITFVLGAEMLRLAGVAKTESEARARMQDTITSGAARAKLAEIVTAQGGDARVVEEPDRLAKSKTRVAVKASKAGFVHGIDAMEVGLTGVAMGAGRTRADQAVDPAVGIVLHAVRGDRVAEGDTLAELHVQARKGTKEWADRVAAAYAIKKTRPGVQPLVLDVIRR
ncbi:MAG: thymidine phosphorylase [Sandaracinaceae bacterium]|nr:thymidine phosphorylase [Sandaracinaceae bacterium]